MAKMNERALFFLSAYYVLLAYISHSTSCWLWEDLLNQNIAASWQTLHFDIAHDYRFFAFIFLSWLFFSFFCALAPTVYFLRMFTFLFTIYILTIGNLLQSGFAIVGDIVLLMPLGLLGVAPNYLINKGTNKLNLLRNRLHLGVALVATGAFSMFWYPRFTYNFGLIFLIALVVLHFSKED